MYAICVYRCIYIYICAFCVNNPLHCCYAPYFMAYLSIHPCVYPVRQYTQLCLHNNNRYSCVVDELETDESFPILPSQTGWCKVYKLRPLLANNRHKRGLALDGKLKHEDTNLASSTILCNPNHKENLGMTVQYRVKVRLVLGFVSSLISHRKSMAFSACDIDIPNFIGRPTDMNCKSAGDRTPNHLYGLREF
uniref:Uncharacterized protein n=1 Tax=Trichobilharzia regenti TaxID=157069 RepID=A0AA85J4C9_TRIRE|nr:unnamed protein product [Trichobilharzia regenti]